MVQFIESELVLLKKEIDEMWTLVYNQLGRAGEAVLTLDRELAQQVLVLSLIHISEPTRPY